MPTETDKLTESVDLNTTDRAKAMQEAPPMRQSIWSTKQRLVRLLWGTIGKVIWLLAPSCRSSVLRWFGASVGKRCSFSGTVEITIPWNLTAGDDCHIGDHVILYSLGQITLGNSVRIDTRAHLCAGTHDMRDTTFPLLRPPIVVGNGTYIGVDAYVAPDVTIGSNCTIWPRASVYRNVEDNAELSGNPARPVE